jgi:hypothetical protein
MLYQARNRNMDFVVTKDIWNSMSKEAQESLQGYYNNPIHESFKSYFNTKYKTKE